MAQQQENHPPNNNALALLLQSKGILSSSELAMINQASSADEANARLAQLLVEKGLISRQEYSSTVAPVSMESSDLHLSNAVLHTTTVTQTQSATTPTGTPPASTGPPIISAAILPLVVPLAAPKQRTPRPGSNICSVGSSQFGLRLAYMRLDTKLGDTLPWFAEFGQDWSLISSSLPSLFESTGLGIGMGTLYERLPQFRTGVQFHAGDLKIQPEFAIVLPVAGSAGLTPDQRARFGDRAGSDSNQPGLEARVVLPFPLSHSWKGVAPAQIIVSGHHARMNEIIPHAAQVAATSFTF